MLPVHAVLSYVYSDLFSATERLFWGVKMSFCAHHRWRKAMFLRCSGAAYD